jgi:hypothetical protein
MKELTFIFFFSCLFLNSSCDHDEVKESIPFDRDVRQVLFFSNESESNREDTYYDALIELKGQFPQEMDSMMVLSENKEKNYYETFNIQESPAIIVIYQDEVMVNINGIASKDEIVQSISKAFSIE